MGDTEKSLSALRRGTTANATEYNPYTNMGFILVEDDKYAEALTYFEEASDAGDGMASSMAGHYYSKFTDDWVQPYQEANHADESPQTAIEYYTLRISRAQRLAPGM